MKKWGWMIGIMVWSLFRVEAQNRLKFIMDKEGKLFAIPVETNYEIRIPEVSYKSYTPVSEQNRQMLERYQDIYQKFSEDTANDIAFFSFPVGEREADRPMNMNTLSEAYRPFFNPYTPMLRSMNPMALDYNEYYLNQRNAKLSIGEKLNKYYFSELLKFPQIKKRLTGISRGVRQANISNKDIFALRVPIPPLTLQKQFAVFVEQTDKSKLFVNAYFILIFCCLRCIINTSVKSKLSNDKGEAL